MGDCGKVIRLMLSSFLFNCESVFCEVRMWICMLMLGWCCFSCLSICGSNVVMVLVEVFSLMCLVSFSICWLIFFSVWLVVVSNCCVWVIRVVLMLEGCIWLCWCNSSGVLMCFFSLLMCRFIVGGVRCSLCVVVVKEFRLVMVIRVCRWFRFNLCIV